MGVGRDNFFSFTNFPQKYKKRKSMPFDMLFLFYHLMYMYKMFRDGMF